MSYQHIAYLSYATKKLSASEIDDLILEARQYNADHDITGILLFDKSRFFQFLEGPPDAVTELFKRIKKSNLHDSIIELSNRKTDARYFNKQSMGFSYIPKTDLQKISQSDWVKKFPKVEHYSNECIGLAMLLAFCADAFKDSSNIPYKEEEA